MFRHQGKNRTYKHNLKIAIILSFVAGIVNVTGFLNIQQLTTNVTGHFALFIYDLSNFQFWKGLIYFIYIFSFLLGSFLSSMLIETFRTNKKLNIYVVPTLVESFILITVPISIFFNSNLQNSNYIACMLLFAMGLQNSYVTKISNAVVRTTHLTGLFTDLGIDVSQLFFPKIHPNKGTVKSNIKLRLYIIGYFFIGGLVGAFLYLQLNLKLNTLYFAAIILLTSLFYDDFKFRMIVIKRKYRFKKINSNSP